LILADDLSGAADCSIACMRTGLDAEVSLGPSYFPSRASIFAVDADTRGLTHADAARRMHELATSFNGDRCTVFFKKIDSTLRGHLGPELAAVLAARRAHGSNSIAVMAPALPAHGRTTLGGVVHLHGRPLYETELWKHERMEGEANIARMLAGSGLRCSHVDLISLRDGVHINSAQCQDTDVIVCDTATDEDLMAIARLATAFGERAIWVGSAGLAHCIPEAAGLVPSPAAADSAIMRPAGPVLFVIGTATQRTREQATVLLSSSEIHRVVVRPDILLSGKESAEWQESVAELASALKNGEDVLLQCDSDPVIQLAYRDQVSFVLAEMTAGLRDYAGTLVASGGETARKVLDRWAVRSLRLQGELESGVPISSASRDDSSTFTVITKAGDFGQPDTLLRCLQWVNKGGTLG
jgi:D-threonate/D-erythronate kinase